MTYPLDSIERREFEEAKAAHDALEEMTREGLLEISGDQDGSPVRRLTQKGREYVARRDHSPCIVPGCVALHSVGSLRCTVHEAHDEHAGSGTPGRVLNGPLLFDR